MCNFPGIVSRNVTGENFVTCDVCIAMYNITKSIYDCMIQVQFEVSLCATNMVTVIIQ